VPENGSVYVIRLKTESTALKLIFLGTALSKGNKKIGICSFSSEDGKRAKLPNVVHSESVVYINQTS
jgi:hypothetical protein